MRLPSMSMTSTRQPSISKASPSYRDARQPVEREAGGGVEIAVSRCEPELFATSSIAARPSTSQEPSAGASCPGRRLRAPRGISPAIALEHVGQRHEAEEVAVFVDDEGDVHVGVLRKISSSRSTGMRLRHDKSAGADCASMSIMPRPAIRSATRSFFCTTPSGRPMSPSRATTMPRIGAFGDFARDRLRLVVEIDPVDVRARRHDRGDRRSASASTPWIISSSTSSMTPASVPSAIANFTSSSVTPSGRSSGMRRSIEQQRGRALEKPDQRAARSARRSATGARPAPRSASGLASAMRFGTSSPTIDRQRRDGDDNDRDERDLVAMRRENRDTCSSTAPSRAPSVAPPKAPDRMPISVMPTCTPERKRPGFSASASARAAPRAAVFRHLLQADAPRRDDRHLRQAKKPLSRMSPTTIASSSHMLMMRHVLARRARGIAIVNGRSASA